MCTTLHDTTLYCEAVCVWVKCGREVKCSLGMQVTGMISGIKYNEVGWDCPIQIIQIQTGITLQIASNTPDEVQL